MECMETAQPHQGTSSVACESACAVDVSVTAQRSRGRYRYRVDFMSIASIHITLWRDVWSSQGQTGIEMSAEHGW
jgi:hypothetical protein